MARDVFISYSQPDRDCAFELTQYVESQGFSVWIAPRDISPAAEWAAEIVEAIAAARVMVLVFSASSNSSPQVRREVERAVHKDLRILPFRLENVLPAHSLEYFLSTQHWLDGFPGPRMPHYERLCTFLRQWLVDAPGQPFALESPGAAAPQAADTGSGTFWHGNDISAEQLRELELRLARVLGPIAGVLLDRAVAATDNFLELERRLAAEIESPEDQRRFLNRRP